MRLQFSSLLNRRQPDLPLRQPKQGWIGGQRLLGISLTPEVVHVLHHNGQGDFRVTFGWFYTSLFFFGFGFEIAHGNNGAFVFIKPGQVNRYYKCFSKW